MVQQRQFKKSVIGSRCYMQRTRQECASAMSKLPLHPNAYLEAQLLHRQLVAGVLPQAPQQLGCFSQRVRNCRELHAIRVGVPAAIGQETGQHKTLRTAAGRLHSQPPHAINPARDQPPLPL